MDELLKTRVAGHRFKLTEADAMTDKQNVWMSLPASTTLWDGFADKRPILTARCIKGKLDVLIAANVVVGGGLDGASVKYRFDSDAPKSEWMVETDDHKGFFVSQARAWLDRIAQHDGKFIVEVPIFQQVPQPITFEVTGADKALAALKAACAN